jgi:hypothetical protein
MRRRIFDDFGNNYSVNFDGVDDFVEAGTTSSFNYYHGATAPTTFAFSIGVWVKFVNPNNDISQAIFNNSNILTANVGINLSLDSRTSVSSSRVIRVGIFRGLVNTAVILAGTANNAYPNSTGWNHILWTHNQSLASANTNLYINNSLVLTANKISAPSTSNARSALHFGKRSVNNDFYMNGNQFNLFFAQGVITAAERAALFANPKASPQAIISSAAITNAYRFPQGAGNFPTWVDAYGGVNGTMTNQTSANIQLDTP